MTAIPAHAISRLGTLHFVNGLLDASLDPTKESGLTDEEREKSEALCAIGARPWPEVAA